MEREEAIRKISERFKIPEGDIRRLLEKPSKGKEVTAEKTRLSTEKNGLAMKGKNKKSPEGSKAKYLFTLQDYESLLAKMNDCLEQVKHHGREVGDSCAESDSWHDNFSYEEGLRQQGMWKTRYRQLQKIKENSEIVQNSGGEYIGIGATVEMEVNGEAMTKRIGSYMTFSDDDLSYVSPLAQAIIGKGAGEQIKCLLGGKPTSIRIISCQ